VDLDTGKAALPDACADVVACCRDDRAFGETRGPVVRELVRLAKPGGWVLITTPNQLSLLSLITLVIKKRFSAFQDIHYPAHLTALLEIDLNRIAAEAGLTEISILYSLEGRLVLTSRHYPQFLPRLFPRAFSDNILLAGRKLDD